jgi:LysM repeat protein
MRVSYRDGTPLKLAAGIFLAATLALLVQACDLVGGGGNNSLGPGQQSVARPSSIPTATPPATLPEPILLGSAADPGAATNPAGTPAAGGTTTAGGPSTYTVKPGDSLGAIATAMGITGPDQAAWIAEVLRLNNIADARLLAAGQELSLPRSTATASTTPRAGTPAAGATPTRPAGTPGAATPTPGTAATPRPGGTPGAGGTYTVVSGDSPNGIATKLGVPAAQQQAWVAQLLQMNNTTANTLQIGQILQLPPIPR